MKVLVTIISRTPQIAADSLAVGVTWYKLWRNRSRSLLGKPSLADVFLRDGMYFYYMDGVLPQRVARLVVGCELSLFSSHVHCNVTV